MFQALSKRRLCWCQGPGVGGTCPIDTCMFAASWEADLFTFFLLLPKTFFFLLSLLINVWSLAFSDAQKKKVINGIKVALLNLLDQHGKKVANPICGAVSFRYASLCAMRLRCVPGDAWWPRQPLMGAKSCCIHWFPPHIALFPSRSVSLSLFWCEKFVPRQTNSCVFPDHP